MQIVFLNKSYETVPSKLPQDYDYIIPTEYCDLPAHAALQDENGNWITNYPIPSGDQNTNLESGDDNYNDLLDENGAPNWIGNGIRR